MAEIKIDRAKLYKFFEDTGILDSLDDALSNNFYFISFSEYNRRVYNGYLDGAGMDYSMKYGAKAKETICYNGNDIFYQDVEDTFSSEEGYDPEIVTKGDLIRHKSIRFDDKILIDNPKIREELDTLIIANFSITKGLIDCYNNGNEEDVKRIETQISEIIKYDKGISDDKAKIVSLEKTHRFLEKSINSAKDEKREIKYDLLLNKDFIIKDEDDKEKKETTL